MTTHAGVRGGAASYFSVVRRLDLISAPAAASGDTLPLTVGSVLWVRADESGYSFLKWGHLALARGDSDNMMP